jgi:aspartate racemase
MKPKPIGILGGAGPLAGTALVEQVFTLSGKDYGCSKDADFPKVFLLSFPFSEMLTPTMDVRQIKKELRACIEQLRQNGAAIIAIACNTLHAFLNEEDNLTDIIQLPKEAAAEIPPGEIPLVLCTSTSVQFGLHKRYFPCIYPDAQTQAAVDSIINRILKGENNQAILQDLLAILQSQTTRTVVLGCTELSLFTKSLSGCNQCIIDPLEIAAKKILKRSFT